MIAPDVLSCRHERRSIIADRILTMRGLLALILFAAGLMLSPAVADSLSEAKIVKLSKKGKKVAETLCKQEHLPKPSDSVEKTIEALKASKACPPLSHSKLEAVAYYLMKGSVRSAGKELTVPQDAKCPVCGMFVWKYPKWAAEMIVEGKRYYFDGVKDMMKFYIFDADFPYDRNRIDSMQVTDFYTLESIPAKEAYYVLGSNVYGPMGNELIPFRSLREAENFKNDHKGEKIVRFGEIDSGMVMALDGLE